MTTTSDDWEKRGADSNGGFGIERHNLSPGRYYSPDGGYFTIKEDRLWFDDGTSIDMPIVGTFRCIPVGGKK
jgi:hypothetical protein